MAVADRVTVMRKGRVVDTVPVAMHSKSQLARMMVGHDVDFRLPARRPGTGAPALIAEDLWVQSDRGLPAVRGVSVVVHRQEIFGIAGVAGNGQRELVGALTGLRPGDRGRPTLGGPGGQPLRSAAKCEVGGGPSPSE